VFPFQGCADVWNKTAVKQCCRLSALFHASAHPWNWNYKAKLSTAGWNRRQFCFISVLFHHMRRALGAPQWLGLSPSYTAINLQQKALSYRSGVIWTAQLLPNANFPAIIPGSRRASSLGPLGWTEETWRPCCTCSPPQLTSLNPPMNYY